jgi:hypothetical protein
MPGLDHQEITSARNLLLEPGENTDSSRRPDFCLDNLIERVAGQARNLEASLSLLSSFREACETARSFSPSATRPVYSRELQNNRNEALSLLGIHPESRIPVHDHPGMLSLLHVIEGRIHAPRYDITGCHEGNGFVELVRHSGKILESGDAAVILPYTGNLHSLQALDRNAVCLTLHLHLRQDREPRSWYFPLASEQRGNSSVLWYRKQDKEICNGI